MRVAHQHIQADSEDDTLNDFSWRHWWGDSLNSRQNRTRGLLHSNTIMCLTICETSDFIFHNRQHPSLSLLGQGCYWHIFAVFCFYWLHLHHIEGHPGFWIFCSSRSLLLPFWGQKGDVPNTCFIEDIESGPGEMAQWSRVYTALAVGPSAVPNAHIRQLTSTYNSIYNWSNAFGLWGPYTHMYISAQHM